MKVLLIYPPIVPEEKTVTPPIKAILIGLAYIGAYLRTKGHEVMILDGVVATDEMIREVMLYFNPQVVGISAMFTPYVKDTHRITKLSKETLPNAKVVVGGAHASTFPDEVLADPNVDFVIIGEGEIAFADLLENLHQPRGKIEVPMVENLDFLPFPAWDLMENDLQEIKEQTKSNKFIMRKPAIHLITSRGCPKGCYFCSVNLMWGRKWRARSADNVLKEMEWLKNMGYREFYFMDDNATVNKKRMHAICDGIIQRKWNIRLALPTGVALDGLDKDILKKMKRAGFYRLCFGIESGNQESQKIIGKNIDLVKAKSIIKLANKLGFWTAGTFILGFPHETLKEIKDTTDFINSSGMDFPVIHLLNPQPRTKVYDILVEEGLITEETNLNITYANGFRTRFFTNQQLHFIVALIYKKFIIHKIFNFNTYINLLRKISSFEDLKYMFNLATIPLDMIKRSFKGQKLSVIAIRQNKELEEV